MSIVIAGYYGFGNAGDELILLALIRQFRQESPASEIIVFSKSLEETEKTLGVKAVDRWRFWKWFVPLLTAQRFILGGGGLLQEKSGPWNYFYYLTLLVLAKACGCRTEVVAIGVDPIKSRFNRFWTRFALNHWTDEVSVRDEDSRGALQAARVAFPIMIRPDPVGDLVVEDVRVPSMRIALAIAGSASGQKRSHEISKLLRRIRSELHAPMELVVFFPKEDAAFAREIVRHSMLSLDVRIWENPMDLLSWISQYQLVISSRFHALVLAARHDIPFIGWGPQKKVESFCKSHQMPYTNTDEEWSEEHLFAQIAGLYQSANKSVILEHELIDFPR